MQDQLIIDTNLQKNNMRKKDQPVRFFPFLYFKDEVQKSFCELSAFDDYKLSQHDLINMETIQITQTGKSVERDENQLFLHYACETLVTVQLNETKRQVKLPLVAFLVFCDEGSYNIFYQFAQKQAKEDAFTFRSLSKVIYAFNNKLKSDPPCKVNSEPICTVTQKKPSKGNVRKLRSSQHYLCRELMKSQHKDYIARFLRFINLNPPTTRLLQGMIELNEKYQSSSVYSDNTKIAYEAEKHSIVFDIPYIVEEIVPTSIVIRDPGINAMGKKRKLSEVSATNAIEDTIDNIVFDNFQHQSASKFYDDMNDIPATLAYQSFQKVITDISITPPITKKLETEFDTMIEEGLYFREDRLKNPFAIRDVDCMQRYSRIRIAYHQVCQTYEPQNLLEHQIYVLFPKVIGKELIMKSIDTKVADFQYLYTQKKHIAYQAAPKTVQDRGVKMNAEQTVEARIKMLRESTQMYFDQHSDIKPMPTNGTRLSLIGNSQIQTNVLSDVFIDDQEYLRYNFIPYHLRKPSDIEYTLLKLYFNNIEENWVTLRDLKLAHKQSTRPINLGSPYQQGYNHRLAYFPYYYLVDSSDLKRFECSNKRESKLAFNSSTLLRDSANTVRAYYSYLDQVQNLCNELMDFVVYSDRQAFTCLAAALLGIKVRDLICPRFANPVKFPLTQLMTLMLFNRDMNNYSFEQIYDYFEVEDPKYSPDQIPNIVDIIEINKEYLEPELLKGNSLIFEMIHFEASNPRIISYFAVVRCNENGELQIKRSHKIPEQTPRMNSSLIISDRFKDLKNEIFDEIKYAFNMELIRVRIYLCKRVPEVLSRIDKEAVSQIYYCRNFLVRFLSQQVYIPFNTFRYTLFDIELFERDLKGDPLEIYDMINKFQDQRLRTSISYHLKSPDDLDQHNTWTYQEQDSSKLYAIDNSIKSKYDNIVASGDLQKGYLELKYDIDQLIQDHLDIYTTLDLIEKLARLVCYRRSAKPEDNDYRLYQEIGRYLQDKIESRVGVQRTDVVNNILRQLKSNDNEYPQEPKYKHTPHIPYDILEWIDISTQHDPLKAQKLYDQMDVNNQPLFQAELDKQLQRLKIDELTKSDTLILLNPVICKLKKITYCMYSPMYHLISQKTTKAKTNLGHMRKFLHPQILKVANENDIYIEPIISKVSGSNRTSSKSSSASKGEKTKKIAAKLQKNAAHIRNTAHAIQRADSNLAEDKFIQQNLKRYMVKRNAGIILPPNDEDLEDSEVESMEDIVQNSKICMINQAKKIWPNETDQNAVALLSNQVLMNNNHDESQMVLYSDDTTTQQNQQNQQIDTDSTLTLYFSDTNNQTQNQTISYIQPNPLLVLDQGIQQVQPNPLLVINQGIQQVQPDPIQVLSQGTLQIQPNPVLYLNQGNQQQQPDPFYVLSQGVSNIPSATIMVLSQNNLFPHTGNQAQQNNVKNSQQDNQQVISSSLYQDIVNAMPDESYMGQDSDDDLYIIDKQNLQGDTTGDISPKGNQQSQVKDEDDKVKIEPNSSSKKAKRKSAQENNEHNPIAL